MQIQILSLVFLFSLLFSPVSFAAARKGKKVEFIDDKAIIQAAKEFGAFDHKLVLAIIKIESGNNRFAFNGRDRDGRGTFGLMQLKVATARYMGFTGGASDLYNWKTNLKYGIRYLNYQYRRYGSVPSALAAYNAGSVFICKGSKKNKRCTPGTFVNQTYVRSVLYHYRKIIDLDNNGSLLASDKDR